MMQTDDQGDAAKLAVIEGWTWIKGVLQTFYILDPDENIIAICGKSDEGDWVKIRMGISESDVKNSYAIARADCGCDVSLDNSQ